MLKREKFIQPSRDEVFIWEFFISLKADFQSSHEAPGSWLRVLASN